MKIKVVKTIGIMKGKTVYKIILMIGVAFLSGETLGTFNKVCYYDYMGDTYTINVDVVDLCPLSINVD